MEEADKDKQADAVSWDKAFGAGWSKASPAEDTVGNDGSATVGRHAPEIDEDEEAEEEESESEDWAPEDAEDDPELKADLEGLKAMKVAMLTSAIQGPGEKEQYRQSLRPRWSVSWSQDVSMADAPHSKPLTVAARVENNKTMQELGIAQERVCPSGSKLGIPPIPESWNQSALQGADKLQTPSVTSSHDDNSPPSTQPRSKGFFEEFDASISAPWSALKLQVTSTLTGGSDPGGGELPGDDCASSENSVSLKTSGAEPSAENGWSLA